MVKTLVNASVKYEILTERGILSRCGELVAAVLDKCRLLIITDDNVDRLYAKTVIASLEENGFSCIKYVFPHGEKNKSMENFEKILEFATENRLTRSDAIVALGGGVCGDLAGFTAASYLRGIKFIQIPTTFLAAIDSSVGGKTAVNLKSGKNLAGAFHQPSMVIIDPDTFKTLEPHYYSDGTAEAVKYGILTDEDLFEHFKSREIDIETVIAKCTKIKSGIVERDEFENGERKLLNLGHTFGHAIEKLSGLTVTHGHAVAIGMMIAARSAEAFGICEKGVSEKIEEVLRLNGLPYKTKYSAEEIYSVSLNDKKRSGNSITVVLPEKIGKCCLKKLTLDEYREYVIKGIEG